MKKIIVFLVAGLMLGCIHREPEIKIESVTVNNYGASIRGLYMVDDKVTWASGTDGLVMRTTNNSDWEVYRDTTWNGLDFRDIHAFNKNEAIVMSSGDGCKMYKTKDGMRTWKMVYENQSNGIFFDGMDFWDDKNGIAFSDPVDQKLYIIITNDGGETWTRLNSSELPSTLKGEAGFAASGTGISCAGDSTVYIGTGGGVLSRVFVSFNRGRTWEVHTTAMKKGEASGIYSLALVDKYHAVAVGGNYIDSTSMEGNCVYTYDGGRTWEEPVTRPKGYRSCVATNREMMITCGRTGIDVSYDKGENWRHVSDDAYYSCVLGKTSGWLFGRTGKGAKITVYDK